MTEMSDEEQIQALLAGGGTELPYNPQKDADALRAALRDYTAPRAFKEGDIVRAKLGLCVNFRKFQKLALIYVKPLEKPQEIFFPNYFHLDCVLGGPDSEGDLQMHLADSGRLELYPPDELEAMAQEAARAVN